METSKDEYGFKLLKIETKQFAIFEDNLGEAPFSTLEMTIRFKFGVDPKRSVGVFALFELQNEKVPLVKIECGVHFELNDFAWNCTLDEKENTIKISQEEAMHFGGIAIAATRGALHAKTEQTPLNAYPIPLISMTDYIESDIIFKMPKKSPS